MIVVRSDDKVLFLDNLQCIKIEQIRGTRKWTLRINFGNRQTQTIGVFSNKEIAKEKMIKLTSKFVHVDGMTMVEDA